jgi:argininosuccinate lyase
LYAQALAKAKLPEAKLPIREAEFRQVLSPEAMVRTRVGVGGPQPAEVERMLAEAQARLKTDKAWMQGTRQKLAQADQKLDQAFRQVLQN